MYLNLNKSIEIFLNFRGRGNPSHNIPNIDTFGKKWFFSGFSFFFTLIFFAVTYNFASSFPLSEILFLQSPFILSFVPVMNHRLLLNEIFFIRLKFQFELNYKLLFIVSYDLSFVKILSSAHRTRPALNFLNYEKLI